MRAGQGKGWNSLSSWGRYFFKMCHCEETPYARWRPARPLQAESLPHEGHSERSAWMTSTRAARAAGSIEATTAAPNSTNAETITGNAPGIFKPPK